MQWGAWGGTGMAIKNDLLPRIIKSGLGVLAPGAGVSALAAALSTTPLPAQLVVSPFEWPKLMQGATHVFPIFSEYATHFKPPTHSLAAPSAAGPTALQRLRPLPAAPAQGVGILQAKSSKMGTSGTTTAQATAASTKAAVVERVAAVVSSVMGKSVDSSQPLMEAGLDSLGAVELRTSLGQQFGQELPATIVFDYPTILQLATYIASLATSSYLEAAPQNVPTVGMSAILVMCMQPLRTFSSVHQST